MDLWGDKTKIIRVKLMPVFTTRYCTVPFFHREFTQQKMKCETISISITARFANKTIWETHGNSLENDLQRVDFPYRYKPVGSN